MNCPDQTIGENFALTTATAGVLKGLPASSVHYSIFSPRSPASTPTAIARETWATAAATRNFSSTSGYLVDELARVMQPGRNVSFHCMLLPASKERDGFIGLKIFAGSDSAPSRPGDSSSTAKP